MKFVDLLTTANRNLARSKLRTLLTVLAIFVGAFTLTLTTALDRGARDYLDRQLGNLSAPGIFQVMPKTELNPTESAGVKEYDPNKKSVTIRSIITGGGLTDEDTKKLKQVEGVSEVNPFYNVTGEYIGHGGSAKKYEIKEMTGYFGLRLDLAAGRLITNEDTNAAILPEEYLEPLGISKAEDIVGTTLTLGFLKGRTTEERTVKVVGIMRKSFVTQEVFIDNHLATEIAEAQGQSARFIAAIVKFKDATDQTDEKQLKDRLQAAGNYTAISLKERIGTFISIVTAITAALNVVGIIALAAASFGIINTLLMSVYERTQEIGLMKALGMHRGKVFGLFAIEAVLVGFWGSVVAVGAAWLASLWVNQYASATFLKDFEGFKLLSVTPDGAGFVIGLIMLIAFVAGTLPAIKASRLDPIEALRSE